ncbi:MAG: hypothetical protein Fur0016_33440 [Anaerolineales bacterium]
MLPISLENQILPGSLEHTIHEVVEKHMDLGQKDLRLPVSDGLAGLCEHLRSQTHEPIHAALESQSGCNLHNIGKICVFGTLN